MWSPHIGDNLYRHTVSLIAKLIPEIIASFSVVEPVSVESLRRNSISLLFAFSPSATLRWLPMSQRRDIFTSSVHMSSYIKSKSVHKLDTL